MSPVGIAERTLSESAPAKVADAAEKIAGSFIEEIEASLPGALAGERMQVRVYVSAYRALTDRLLSEISTVRPNLVALDDAHHVYLLAGLQASRRTKSSADWFRVALEQEAMSAPFSTWVGALGAGRGTAVALLAYLRKTLPGMEPLMPPNRRDLPDWKLDSSRTVSFYRSVLDELERVETPLQRIASLLGLTLAELALLFDVRRQAMEQWEDRSVPAQRQEKLATLGEITDLLSAKVKRDRIPGIVRRSAPAYGGRTILQAIAEGDEELVLAELRDAFDWAAAA